MRKNKVYKFPAFPAFPAFSKHQGGGLEDNCCHSENHFGK
jgi:hypothetical protein